MVAYNFKPRFAPLIAAPCPVTGVQKTQTMRANGNRRHARPGEALQLYVGQRTADCRKIIPDPICVASHRVDLHFDFNGGWIDLYADADGEAIETTAALDAFARRDGFLDFAALRKFFTFDRRRLEGTGPWVSPNTWTGTLIRWASP